MAFDEPIDPRDRADFALLDSAVNRPFQTFGGEYLHVTLFQQAAALFHSLVCNHCFTNGNKRTAVMALDMFMTANGYCLLMSNDQIYEMAKATAQSNQNGLPYEEVLAGIAAAVQVCSVPLSELLSERFAGVKNVNSLHDYSLEVQTHIRNDPKNQPQPVDPASTNS